MMYERQFSRSDSYTTAGKPKPLDHQNLQAYLVDDIEVVTAVDGSEPSMQGFEYIVKGLMQQDRHSHVSVVHIYDDSKDYLPPAWRKSAIHAVCEATCISNLLPARFQMQFQPRSVGEKVGVQIAQEAARRQADFICMGTSGRKASKGTLASNIHEVIRQGVCSLIVINSKSLVAPPVARSTKYVVLVNLDVASTKAFMDAVKLSKPGDEIIVVHIRSHLDDAESEESMLRKKYQGFLQSLEGSSEAGWAELARFQGRTASFEIVDKQPGETVANAIVRYTDDVEADFTVIGTSTTRVGRGKDLLGSVAMGVVKDIRRNFIISAYTPRTASKSAAAPVVGGC